VQWTHEQIQGAVFLKVTLVSGGGVDHLGFLGGGEGFPLPAVAD